MFTLRSRVGAIMRRQVLARFAAMAGSMASEGFSGLMAAPRRAAASWAGFRAPLGWDTFEIATGDTLIVSAEVVGVHVRAILDSGSGATVVSGALAARLNRNRVEKRVLRGMSGKTEVKIVRDVEIMFGHVLRHLPFVAVADLETVSSAFGRPIDLILGEDMFTDRCVVLDFVHSRFALLPSGSFAAPEDWTPVTLTHGANQELLIQASVSRLPAVSLMFDLGSSAALMLSSSYVTDHDLLNGNRQSTVALGGVEGVRIATAFTLERANIGEMEIGAIPAVVVENWLATTNVGNIGLPLIAQFDVVLDVTAERLWLRALPPASRLPLLKDRTGLGLAASATALTVVHVAANSPASKGNWAVGDRIVAVNGRPIDEAYTHESLWRWRYGAADTLVELKTAKGDSRELRLACYY